MFSATRRIARFGLPLLALATVVVPGAAADLSGYADEQQGPPIQRYFPRGDGEEAGAITYHPRQRRIACMPRRVPVPTDAPDDPSYVGSPYGLGKPSYYGFRPQLGYDDPFGRPLQYCP